jgi:hypothetical protein
MLAFGAKFANITGMEEAKKLREIAGALTQLEPLNKAKTEAAKKVRRKALTMLFENWPLVAEAQGKYSLHPFLRELWTMLQNTAAEWKNIDLGVCREFDLRFSKRRTGGAEHRSFIDELNRWADELEAGTGQEKDGQGSGRKPKISKEEANVRVRELLRETPTWDWTTRKLAEQIPCSLGWISYLPAWRAYHEKRKELRRAGTIKTVSLSDEFEAVLGTGKKDNVLNQLIAEQEKDQRQDARQAKLYLSQKKKPDRSRW